MHYEAVLAHIFGAISGQRLELTPGLNVIWGLNEAGKSTWQMALYAGLCGRRRGGRASERDHLDRYRPWGQADWQVGAIVRLADGRGVELRHELVKRVDCWARDVATGVDYTSEIIADGAPDGAVWLGLSRAAFLSVACVRQAEIVRIRDEAASLQELLQRAATSAEGDRTTAAALTTLLKFQSEEVGADRRNAVGPRGQVRRALDQAEAQLATVKAQHAAGLDRQLKARQLRDEAVRARQGVTRLQAHMARQRADRLRDELAEAKRLFAALALAPTELATDPDRLQEIDRLLVRWRERSDPPTLEGRTAVAIAAELAALPETPTGDLAPTPEAVAAHQALERASAVLAHQRAAEPVLPGARPLPTGVDAETVRRAILDLRDLDRQPPPGAAGEASGERSALAAALGGGGGGGLGAQVGGPAGGGRGARPARPAALGIGVVGLLAALVLGLATGWLVGSLVLLAAGVAAASLLVLGRTAQRRRAANDAARQAAEAKTRREALHQRLARANLPSSVAALETLLADEMRWQNMAERQAEWQGTLESLEAQHEAAMATLTRCLSERGAPVDQDAEAAWLAYTSACSARDLDARRAARRPDLERELEQRQKLEADARAAADALQALEAELIAAAAEQGVPAETTEAAANTLRHWLTNERDLDRQRGAARVDQAALQTLLRGRTLDELGTEAAAATRHASGIGGNDEPAAAPEDAWPTDPQAELHRRQTAAEQAEQAAAQAEGEAASAPDSSAVAEAEEAAANQRARLGEIETLDQVLDRTRHFLEQAQARVHRDIAPRLNAHVDRHLAAVTAGRYTGVRVDPATLNVTVRDPAQEWRAATDLSHGTGEQIYLLLRVALADLLTRVGEVCPLILDDVTVQSDRQRTVAILDLLHRLAEQRQVVLFTQEDDVRQWALARQLEGRHRYQDLPAPSAGSSLGTAPAGPAAP